MIVVMTTVAVMALIVAEIIMIRPNRSVEQGMIGGQIVTVAPAGRGVETARMLIAKSDISWQGLILTSPDFNLATESFSDPILSHTTVARA